MKILRNRRKCNKKRKKMKPSEISVVILSDSESEADGPKVITIDESDTSSRDPEVEIITLDDSTILNKSIVPFKLDPSPDFIPLNVVYNKPTKRPLRKRRVHCSPEVTVFRMTKRLRREQLASTTPTDSNCKLRNSKKKSQVRVSQNSLNSASSSNFAHTRLNSNKKSADKPKNDFRKPKIPQISLTHTNILNTLKSQPTEGLRPVIIDGCNVGFHFGNGEFSFQGIIYVVQYFQNRGHDEIVCFLPQNYRNRFKELLVTKTIKEYEKEDIIVYTPTRFLNGKLIKPYDDRFIVQYASERGGVIISNDGYRDLIDEELSWRTTIEQRIINFTFARGLLMLPKDPLGPEGPTLDEMLKFPS